MRQAPDGPADMICPMHRKAMSKVCKTCPLWTLVRGKNPQNDADVDRWDCAFAWMPMLAVEQAKNIRGVQAAQESTRNEIVRGTVALASTNALQDVARKIQPPAPATPLLESDE